MRILADLAQAQVIAKVAKAIGAVGLPLLHAHHGATSFLDDLVSCLVSQCSRPLACYRTYHPWLLTTIFMGSGALEYET